ncbi:MAG TPA: aminoacyl-tRNA hydrolase [Candidatus Eisenbacteria bacterium]|nr:aminoacyl-tRNA hydrolase [Candidatus Eisenbacteria bacterium]
MVVGLGNPGSEYDGTRHNAGFMAVDLLARKLGRFTGWRRDGVVMRGEGRADWQRVSLVKPQTYMNRSGEALRALLAGGWLASEILVVFDDVYLPLGSIRLRPFGGTGGHQGLESIREEIGTTEFPRLRIGVGPAPASADLPDFVLSPFDEEERARLPDVLEGAASAAYDAAASGLGQAMNRWNRFGLDPVEE